MKKYFSILLLLLVTITLTLGQENQTIEIENFDNELLSELIFVKINEVRKNNNVSLLKSDSKLEQAAQLQVNSCLTYKMSHYHKKKKFNSLRDRVNYYNGVHEHIAENLSYSKKINEPTTYETLANAIVSSWLESNGNMKHITNSFFNNTGIKTLANVQTRKIIVVQVFGSAPIEFDGYYSPANAYDFISEKNKNCQACKKGLDTLYYISADVEGNNVYLNVRNLDYFKKVFSGNYYFSVDIIQRSQFPCNSNNLLHSSPYHDGYLLPPTSKATLLKNNTSKNSLQALIGHIPFELEGEYETNLIITKKKAFSKKKPICVTIINSNSYGYDLDIMPPTLLIDTLNALKSITVTNKLKFIIPFQKNKYDYTQEDIKPLIDSLKLNESNITSLKVYAFASVEGDSKRNLDLQRNRAKSILEVFQDLQLDTIKTKVRTTENWRDFRKSIKHTKYAYLLKLSKTQIKVELTQLSEELEPLLAKHRKAIVYLETVEKIDLCITPKDLLEQYQNLLNDSLSPIKDILTAQKKVFSFVLKGHITVSDVSFIEIPNTPKYIKVIDNQMTLEYLENKRTPPYLELLLYDSLAKKHPRILYNIYGFMIQHWYKDPYIDIDPATFLKNIKKINSTKMISTGEYYKMMVNYHISAANYYRQKEAYKLEKRSTKYVLDQYSKASLSDKDALVLSNFLVYHGMISQASKLLKPHVEKPDVREDILFYYLSLIIYDNTKVGQDNFDLKMELGLEMNKKRFCELFGYPAFTFQLMRNSKLKTMYCENCDSEESKSSVKSIIGNDVLDPKILELKGK